MIATYLILNTMKTSIYSKTLLACTFLLFLIPLSTNAQTQSEVVSITWGEPVTQRHGEEYVKVPNVKGQSLDGYRPNFFFKKSVENEVESIAINSIQTTPATTEDKKYLDQFFIRISETFEADYKVSSASGEKSAIVSMMPFIRKKGQIHRIISFEVIYKKGVSGAKKSYAKKSVVNSVLAQGNGDWYKISVSADGFYRIDKTFLQELGLDIDNINPQHINIYGNGDGLLPKLNSAPRTDDLAKNAIQIIGASDGSFDSGDYIIFYGWGPHRWSQDTDSTFNNERHVYSDVSCYFINVNPSETPLRFQNNANATNPITHLVNTYSEYRIYEQDFLNLVGGGSRWYGEVFDEGPGLTRSFNFTIPNIDVNTPASFQVYLASNTNSASGTAQKYSINGAQLFESELPPGTDFGRSKSEFNFNNPTAAMPLQIQVIRNTPDVLTYLDKITLNARRELNFVGTQLQFRDLNSVGAGNVAEYQIENMPQNGFVWEITNRHIPGRINGASSSGIYNFSADSDSLRTYAISNGSDFLTPTAIGSVESQNLHALSQVDYLIVTHRNFVAQAERLANLHKGQGLEVHVVTVDKIYNEFSSGMQDAAAIRMLAKMFYDRSSQIPGPSLKYLCLFGDGTYDPKNRVANNNNFVPTFQFDGSNFLEDHIKMMPADSYFGILDDNEAIFSSDMIDVYVGRMLVSNNQMAKELVDKVEHYMNNGSGIYSTANTNCGNDEYSSTFGDWRTTYVLIADDEEQTNLNGELVPYFIGKDVEPQYEYVNDTLPEMNCIKIYQDAYPQVTTAGGERYPEVNAAIDSRIERGALLINYVGHGGEVGLAEERVVTLPMIQNWRNIDVMPLMVSATCEFTKFDDPGRVSAGEWASLNPYGAAIALMTTTRSVWFDVNTNIGREFIRNVFQRDDQLRPKTFGEIIARTLNEVGTDNKRSFTLIGDPALRLALPNFSIVTDSINGQPAGAVTDTIKALSKVTIKGHVNDFNDQLISGFNGVLYPTIYDKPRKQSTLGNDEESPIYEFETQTNKVYRGKASVKNGAFEFTFIVPKDINYAIDFGKISYYAENGSTDAFGFDTSFLIGGLDPNGIEDSEGPTIELYINDENFVSTGITDETPVLVADVFDENGINTVGNGVGHDIVAVLDGETANPIVLNDFYTSDLDSYQSGQIRYNFAALEPGPHTLSLKVWDVNNNSAERSVEFVVQEQENVVLDHVLNYPNPFTTRTEFFFEHNQVCSQLDVQIQILTVAGNLVKTINRSVQTQGFRSEGIVWDGLDDFGDQLAKGVYIYRLKVRTPEGEIAEKLEKLVLLR
jgi:hypothetical protein